MPNLLHAAVIAIDSCRGDHLVASLFSTEEYRNWFNEPWYCIAIGKASGAMAMGALSLGKETLVSGFVVTKTAAHSWFDDKRIAQYESAHPLSDTRSFAAGDALVAFVRTLPSNARILFLLSGGASALVEVLSDDMSVASWQALTAQWLASGWDIGRINAKRKQLSQIKGGKLLALFPEQCEIVQLVISDVQGDDLATIGSGLLAGNAQKRKLNTHILANNQQLLSTLATKIPNAIIMPHFVCSSVQALAQEILHSVCSARCFIWGGEPVVVLPAHIGRGGRMQHLALLVAWLLQDSILNWELLAMGSDGGDGATEDAGALVNQDTIRLAEQQGWDVQKTLAVFDSGSLLEDVGALVTTGDTGTNVNDMIILWCE